MPLLTRQREEKVRLNLDLAPKVKDQLEDLRVRSNAASLTEVIRRALALLDLVVEINEEGGAVVLRDKQGKEETLRIL